MKFKSTLLAVLLPQLLLAADPGDAIEGRLTSITTTAVTVAGGHSYTINSQTECFDFRRDRTTCETLAGVGYADKGRVTFSGTVARRIDLIELQQ